MSISQTNLLLQITATALGAAALFSLIAGFIAPLEIPVVSSQGAAPATAKVRTPRLPPVNTFAPIFVRSLQPSTVAPSMTDAGQGDSQHAAPTAVVTQLVLVGTIGSSVALIRGPDGSVGMVETGDDVNGAPVMAIRPSECDLRVNGKLTTLRIAPPPDDSGMLQAR